MPVTPTTPAQQSTNNMPEAEAPPTEIIVYICPTPGCGNHYAAPDFRPDRSNIEAMQHARSQNDGITRPSHSRLQCPRCRMRGLKVDRVGYVVTEIVSLDKSVKAIRKSQNEESSGGGS